MSQPKWRKYRAVGDCNPVDYGGGFVFVDETGVYPPEVEYYESDNDSDTSPVRVYRFIVEPCTYIDGVLSDNKYHPEHAAWFADKLPDGVTPQMFCDENIMVRAFAWVEVGLYYGFYEFDQDPLILTREDAEQRANR